MSKSRRRTGVESGVNYEVLEPRKVLAAIFPVYVNGELSLGDELSEAPYPLDQTFNLETNPSATKTIYLDFDGYHSVDNQWNHDIMFPSFSLDADDENFSNAELIEIQKQLQNVAEDFAPFNVNVTTRDPGVDALTRQGGSDTTWGIRVVNSQPTDGFGGNFGGIAFLNSFNDSEDTPAFTFNKGVSVGAMTNSHEVGHSLGLIHDGLGNLEYHPGVGGNGEFSWGPLMGAPFPVNITQWSIGDYENNTSTQDDLRVITSASNGFGFIEDEAGNDRGRAANLESDGGDVFSYGFISETDDVDFYRFQTGGGNINFNVEVFNENPNLDVQLQLFNDRGQLLQSSNPSDSLDASFNAFVPEGTYYIAIDGVGLAGLYSDYGSLGFYTIEGFFPESEESNLVGETGLVSRLYDQWQTVQFNETYENPVVVAGALSRVGGDPSTVRIQNVTSNSFQIRVQEWDYLDGRHGYENVSYMVVEAGEHTLPDGTKILAGVSGGQTHRWKNYSLGSTFSRSQEVPVILSQTISNNDSDAVVTRINNLTKTGFQIRLSEENGSNRVHGSEQVGWIAIEQGIGTNGTSRFIVDATPNQVTEADYTIKFGPPFGAAAPSFFAAMQTHNGGDNSTVRYKALSGSQATIFIEEEQAGDKERLHNAERVGYVAIPRGQILGTDGLFSPPAQFARDASGSQGDTAANANSDAATNGGFYAASLLKTGELVDGDLSADVNELNSYSFETKGFEGAEALLVSMGRGHDHDHSHDLDGNHEPGCCCSDCLAASTAASSNLVDFQQDLSFVDLSFVAVQDSQVENNIVDPKVAMDDLVGAVGITEDLVDPLSDSLLECFDCFGDESEDDKSDALAVNLV